MITVSKHQTAASRKGIRHNCSKTMATKLTEIRTEILINAAPQKVWRILTDFKAYPAWNPFIKSLEQTSQGELKVGSRLKALIAPPDASAMTFTPAVTALNVNREFRWLGHLFIPGLFDGEHIFELMENGDGTTTLIHRENFRGLLIPLFKKMLNDNSRRGFELMNRQLKAQAEA